MTYDDLFSQATGLPAPYPYQARLALGPWPDLLDVPTGLGKTAAITLGWLYKRGWRRGGRHAAPDASTPRRLLWCLPMRVLVEQTAQNLVAWLEALDIHDRGSGTGVSVHVLMGGESDLSSWAERPEGDMVLVGTQDMLLSRALMRGYGMSRYQWPVHYALVHNDALWVFDEVQLMGAGLSTSAQLEAFRRSFPLGRPSRSLWASATLAREWLMTVDMQPHAASLETLGIDESDRAAAGERLSAKKHLERAPLTLTKDAATKPGGHAYLAALCDLVLEAHHAGTQTLVIVNRVSRAQALTRLLAARRPGAHDLLVHARFRRTERAEQALRLRDEAGDRIVVATQAIEAGVDVSSRTLITELAPWSSLVQRFGRCNRYGEWNGAGGARVLWIDAHDDADVAPYTPAMLVAARQTVSSLTSASPDDLPAVNDRAGVSAVLRRKDLTELFNTDPDLSGFDVDVSDYIRDSGLPSFTVFWRDTEDPNVPEVQPAPASHELCPVSISQAREVGKRKPWSWDALGRRWARLERDPRPGMAVMLAAADGGYDPLLGIDLASKTAVPVVGHAVRPADDFGSDRRSQTRSAVALVDHLLHVGTAAEVLCDAVGVTSARAAVVSAARWHDVGKAHAVFQATMHACPDAPAGLLAKSQCEARHARRYFRHELASMLTWLAQHNADPHRDLVAYLIAAHHGRVRTSLRAMPDERADTGVARFARGVWEGDVIEGFAFGEQSSATTVLSLALMEMGDGEQGPSWSARTLALLSTHGPFYLAWLESLVRIADWRASAEEQLPVGDRP